MLLILFTLKPALLPSLPPGLQNEPPATALAEQGHLVCAAFRAPFKAPSAQQEAMGSSFFTSPCAHLHSQVSPSQTGRTPLPCDSFLQCSGHGQTVTEHPLGQQRP